MAWWAAASPASLTLVLIIKRAVPLRTINSQVGSLIALILWGSIFRIVYGILSGGPLVRLIGRTPEPEVSETSINTNQ
jgi:hypothetical protein